MESSTFQLFDSNEGTMHSMMENPEDDEMKRLCVQLDVLLDSFFQTLNQLLVSRQELDKAIKEGFYLMARARYSMGAKSVTSTQYNIDDLQRAFSHVSVLPTSDGAVTFRPELTSSKARITAFGVVRDSKGVGLSDKAGSECVELDEIGCSVLDANIVQPLETQPGLRRRNLPKDTTSDMDESTSGTNTVSPVEDLSNDMTRMSCNTESTKQLCPPLPPRLVEVEEDEAGHGKDPLLWFGLLVPQSLRQSQAAFKNAVKLSCQIATLQNQLIQEKRTYEKMMDRKHELQVELCKLSASVTNKSDDQQETSLNASSENCQSAE